MSETIRRFQKGRVDEPPSERDYPAWLAALLDFEITSATRTYYELVASTIRTHFENSSFWRSLPTELSQLNDEYYGSSGYYLLPGAARQVPELQIYVKPFNSLVNKTFRRNVTENTSYPAAPPGGWFLPDSSFDRVNDIVRTTIVVQYIDGIERVRATLEALAIKSGLEFSAQFKARDTGYYALHCELSDTVSIPLHTWDTEPKVIKLEIQLTTVLLHLIRNLTHGYYETNRSTAKKDPTERLWDYKSTEFTATYMGHVLHYVDGVIMNLRDSGARK